CRPTWLTPLCTIITRRADSVRAPNRCECGSNIMPINRVTVRVWGDYACFTRPEVERVTYYGEDALWILDVWANPIAPRFDRNHIREVLFLEECKNGLVDRIMVQ